MDSTTQDRWRFARGIKVAGLLMVLLGGLAFLIVADDLCHTGELGALGTVVLGPRTR
jgi:hypothetical protein